MSEDGVEQFQCPEDGCSGELQYQEEREPVGNGRGDEFVSVHYECGECGEVVQQ